MIKKIHAAKAATGDPTCASAPQDEQPCCSTRWPVEGVPGPSVCAPASESCETTTQFFFLSFHTFRRRARYDITYDDGDKEKKVKLVNIKFRDGAWPVTPKHRSAVSLLLDAFFFLLFFCGDGRMRR